VPVSAVGVVEGVDVARAVCLVGVVGAVSVEGVGPFVMWRGDRLSDAGAIGVGGAASACLIRVTSAAI
jgi:hypothetical protein